MLFGETTVSRVCTKNAHPLLQQILRRLSMLLARRLCGCETDLRRPLSMLGSLVTGGAEISAEQKGAFILQASTPSTAQEGERPVCSLTTGLARRRTQTLCTTKH